MSHYLGGNHISADDAERYYLNMIRKPEEVALIEEHLLWCHECLDQLDDVGQFVETLRKLEIAQ
jgi:predicted anti-sigma-YlaC factor YlaD